MADPLNINDAALAAAHYLCVAGGDLRTDAGRRRAVLAYNHSDSYVAQVLALAAAYAAGIPVGDLPLLGNTTGPVPPPSGSYAAPAAPGPAIGARDTTDSPPESTAGEAAPPAGAPAAGGGGAPTGGGPTGGGPTGGGPTGGGSAGGGGADGPAGGGGSPSGGGSGSSRDGGASAGGPGDPDPAPPPPPQPAPASAPAAPVPVPLPVPAPPAPAPAAPPPAPGPVPDLVPGITCGLPLKPVCPTP